MRVLAEGTISDLKRVKCMIVVPQHVLLFVMLGYTGLEKSTEVTARVRSAPPHNELVT